MPTAVYLSKQKNDGKYVYILKQPGGIIEATVVKENGKTVEIVGKIDRIDIAKDENNKYIRMLFLKLHFKLFIISLLYFFIFYYPSIIHIKYFITK